MKQTIITLAKHVGLMLLVLVGLGVATFFLLNIFTKHNQAPVEVPNVQELRIDKAIRLLEERGLSYAVTDTVYRDGIELNSIVGQNPEAGMKVKKGRRIYLVINSEDLPMIEMPELAGKTSFQLALKMLKSKGLELGEKIERPDKSIMSKEDEPVLEQRRAGESNEIAPGTMIKMHSKIDLVVAVMIDSGGDSTEITEPIED
jgi:eukaryotic-like serine/threonine-protein kinase